MVQADLPGIEWDINIPLLTNRHMLGPVCLAMLGAAVGAALLVSFPLAIEGEWEDITNVFKLFAVVGLGLFALSLLIMAFAFRNRLRVHFRIDDEGVLLRQIDRTAKAGNRAAFWAGLVLGRPGAVGAGALAISQEEQSLAWSGAFTARLEPATHSIAFRNGWRTLMRVYCPPETYGAAAAKVAAMMAREGAAARVSAHSPLGRYLWRTVLVAVCTVPLFALAEEFDLSGFTPFLLLCFALATVWLIRPLALVVLGSLAWMGLELAASLGEQRESIFGGAPYLRYEVLSGDDWAALAITGLAAGVLAWQSIQTWRGRIVPALTQDWMDSGDA